MYWLNWKRKEKQKKKRENEREEEKTADAADVAVERRIVKRS